jgi:hypothetical protein
MFLTRSSYSSLKLKKILGMHERCPECSQRFDLEPGFWYGTGYVSYALAIAISAATFVAWLIFIGVSFNDNRVFWWLIINSVLLVVLQPWLMRISRVIYLYFFVYYDEDYKNKQPTEFDYHG